MKTERTCPVCGKKLVPRRKECNFAFRRRVHCNTECANLNRDFRAERFRSLGEGMELALEHEEMIRKRTLGLVRGAPRSFDREALHQEVMLEVGKRTSTWNPDGKLDLEKYISAGLRYAVTDVMRKTCGRDGRKEMRSVQVEDEHLGALCTAQDDLAELEGEEVVRALMWKAVKATTPATYQMRNYRMLCEHVLEGRPLSEVGKRWRLTESRACQIKTHVLKAIRSEAQELLAA